MANEQLRFDCSYLWHVCIDDQVDLETAPSPDGSRPGEIWRAKAKDGTSLVAVALDTREHVLLIQATTVVGEKEWTIRLPAAQEQHFSHGALTSPQNGRFVQCDPSSNILAINVEQPPASTVFVVSPTAFDRADTSGLVFKPFPPPK